MRRGRFRFQFSRAEQSRLGFKWKRWLCSSIGSSLQPPSWQPPSWGHGAHLQTHRHGFCNRQPILQAMSSEDETSPEHCPPRRLFTEEEDTWCLKSLSNDLPSPDSCSFKTPQAAHSRTTPSTRRCWSSARQPILLDSSESEDETSELHRPFRTPSTKERDVRPFRTPSNALRASSSKSSTYTTPQASLHRGPSSRQCWSSVRKPKPLDTSESENEMTSELQRPFRTPSTKERDVRPFRTPSNALRAFSSQSSTYSTPQASLRQSPSSHQCLSSVQRPIILDTSDSEGETSAQHWSLERRFSREDALQPSRSPSSVVRTAPDNLCAFSTPQVTRCRVNSPPRRCWSSAKKRPTFLDDNSSSEEENKVPRDVRVSSKHVVRTLLDDDAWFLESLSEDKPLEECHHHAIRFRKQFKSFRKDLTEALFKIFNRELFGDKLPRGEISWYGRLTSTAGRCFYLEQKCFRVELSPKLLDCAERTRDTLLHELCHAAVWCIHGVKGGHSHSGWKFWVDRAARRFPKLPRVERCHNYK